MPTVLPVSVLSVMLQLGGRGPSPAPAATPPHSAFATPPHQTFPAAPPAEAQGSVPGPPAAKGNERAPVASGQVAGPTRASMQQPPAVGAATCLAPFCTAQTYCTCLVYALLWPPQELSA